MDEPVAYKAGSKKRSGLYFVETQQYCPMRGNGWYSQPMVEYGLEMGLIKETDIKYFIRASIQVSKDYFNGFIDYCYTNLGEFAKLAINSMIGCFKPKEREHWKTIAITTDGNNAFNLMLDSNGCFIDHRTIGDQDYYQAYEKFNTKKEETEAPIYNMILDMEAIEMHKLMTLIVSKRLRAGPIHRLCLMHVQGRQVPF